MNTMDNLAQPGAAKGTKRHWLYFLGVDSAPAQKASADDGALFVLRASPRGADVTSPAVLPEDWRLAGVFSRKLRNAGVRQWSGCIHGLHRVFGFSRIMMDPGAGGGGGLIRKDLANELQEIDGQMTRVRPISNLNDPDGGHTADRCLRMFARGDLSIEALWPRLAGDDVLIDAAHTALRGAIERVGITLPPPAKEWRRDQVHGWAQERQLALHCLTETAEQLVGIGIATDSEGNWLMTSRNARRFVSATRRKDLAMSMLYAYAAFATWVADTARYGLIDESDSEEAFASF